ncbi:hypothetical protein Q9L58_008703 [Maublancomyces gigas]|uniref:Uncharacterized protein n=1 Tax=Discina gigas TaxID=1032678 RepID=A0ABR3G8Z0_9PEZI
MLAQRDQAIVAELHRDDDQQHETNDQIVGALNVQSFQPQELASCHEETGEVINDFVKRTHQEQIEKAGQDHQPDIPCYLRQQEAVAWAPYHGHQEGQPQETRETQMVSTMIQMEPRTRRPS